MRNTICTGCNATVPFGAVCDCGEPTLRAGYRTKEQARRAPRDNGPGLTPVQSQAMLDAARALPRPTWHDPLRPGYQTEEDYIIGYQAKPRGDAPDA